MAAVRLVEHGSPEYQATLQLRREVLRWPLGLDFTEEELAAERSDFHLANLEGEAVLACLVFTPLGGCELKMRQVAVRPELQGEGLGKRLVKASEELAKRLGFELISLSARESAVPFYLTQNYEMVGEPYEEVTIPHRKMKKLL